MKRSIILPTLVTAFVTLSPVGVAFADNPHSGPPAGSGGQPSKEEVDNPALKPPGHSTEGLNPQGNLTAFANAEQHYADGTESPLNPARGNTDKAVSQYDVAGFQQCMHRSADISIC
jgi:hypothetical protein